MPTGPTINDNGHGYKNGQVNKTSNAGSAPGFYVFNVWNTVWAYDIPVPAPRTGTVIISFPNASSAGFGANFGSGFDFGAGGSSFSWGGDYVFGGQDATFADPISMGGGSGCGFNSSISCQTQKDY
jgi:hypothetical protein